MPKRPTSASGTSVWQRDPPVGGRRAPACTREQITTEAIAIADADGLPAVTMRRLASALDVAPTSLYWYFSTKDELHELMADAVIGRIELPEARDGWRAGLAAIAWSTLAQARCHPWFAGLAYQPVPGPSTMQYGEAALAVFPAAQVGRIEALGCLAAVNNYVFGFAQRTAASGSGQPPADEGGPLADERRARADLTGDASFAFGLECMLDGIAQRLAAR